MCRDAGCTNDSARGSIAYNDDGLMAAAKSLVIERDAVSGNMTQTTLSPVVENYA